VIFFTSIRKLKRGAGRNVSPEDPLGQVWAGRDVSHIQQKIDAQRRSDVSPEDSPARVLAGRDFSHRQETLTRNAGLGRTWFSHLHQRADLQRRWGANLGKTGAAKGGSLGATGLRFGAISGKNNGVAGKQLDSPNLRKNGAADPTKQTIIILRGNVQPTRASPHSGGHRTRLFLEFY
jgi:hypothetical protein